MKLLSVLFLYQVAGTYWVGKLVGSMGPIEIVYSVITFITSAFLYSD